MAGVIKSGVPHATTPAASLPADQVSDVVSSQTALATGEVDILVGGGEWITASLSGASGQTVTADFATSNGTASAGADYTAVSGTLTFPPGTTTASVPVSPRVTFTMSNR